MNKIADDNDWINSLMTEKGTMNCYQLDMSNFIESIIRISYVIFKEKGLNPEPLSVIFDSYLRTTMKYNCSIIEGFVLVDELEAIEVQEVMDYYEDKLFELYNKLKITAWSPLEYSHYLSFDKISFNGLLFLYNRILQFPSENAYRDSNERKEK